MDRWILSKMTYAIEQADIGFKNYDFQTATTACYNFWLYELCDWYLVSHIFLHIKGQGAVRADFGPRSDFYSFYVYCIHITLFCFFSTRTASSLILVKSKTIKLVFVASLPSIKK